MAIVLYLAEKYPRKGLIPTNLTERAQLNRWLLFAATELEQPLWRISRHTALYPEDQRLPGDLPIASREFEAMAAVLDEHMQGRQFVVGDRATVADFVVAYTLDWGNEARLLDGFPQLLAYMKPICTPARMHRRASPEAFASIQA